MAPEAPGNLVVIDLRFQDGELRGYAQEVEYSPEDMARIEEAGGWFYALWNETPGRNYVPVGGGVVYVGDLPRGYRITERSPVEPDSLGNGRFAYRYPALGAGLMFVLILPEGYTLTDSRPMPRSAKVFEERRLAVYWKPEEQYGAHATITWELEPFTGDLRAERDRINHEIHRSDNVPSNPGVTVDAPVRAGDSEPSADRSATQPDPESWLATLRQMLRKGPPWLGLPAILIVLLAVVVFAIWMSLPDEIKTRLIDVLFNY